MKLIDILESFARRTYDDQTMPLWRVRYSTNNPIHSGDWIVQEVRARNQDEAMRQANASLNPWDRDVVHFRSIKKIKDKRLFSESFARRTYDDNTMPHWLVRYSIEGQTVLGGDEDDLIIAEIRARDQNDVKRKIRNRLNLRNEYTLHFHAIEKFEDKRLFSEASFTRRTYDHKASQRWRVWFGVRGDKQRRIGDLVYARTSHEAKIKAQAKMDEVQAEEYGDFPMPASDTLIVFSVEKV